jgi:hypothetical protein
VLGAYLRAEVSSSVSLAEVPEFQAVRIGHLVGIVTRSTRTDDVDNQNMQVEITTPGVPMVAFTLTDVPLYTDFHLMQLSNGAGSPAFTILASGMPAIAASPSSLSFADDEIGLITVADILAGIVQLNTSGGHAYPELVIEFSSTIVADLRRVIGEAARVFQLTILNPTASSVSLQTTSDDVVFVNGSNAYYFTIYPQSSISLRVNRKSRMSSGERIEVQRIGTMRASAVNAFQAVEENSATFFTLDGQQAAAAAQMTYKHLTTPFLFLVDNPTDDSVPFTMTLPRVNDVRRLARDQMHFTNNNAASYIWRVVNMTGHDLTLAIVPDDDNIWSTDSIVAMPTIIIDGGSWEFRVSVSLNGDTASAELLYLSTIGASV